MQQQDDALRNIEHTARALARIRGACIDGADLRSAVEVIAQSLLELADNILTNAPPSTQLNNGLTETANTTQPGKHTTTHTPSPAYCAAAIAGLHDPIFIPVKPKRSLSQTLEVDSDQSHATIPTYHPLVTPSQPTAIAWLHRAPNQTNANNTTNSELTALIEAAHRITTTPPTQQQQHQTRHVAQPTTTDHTWTRCLTLGHNQNQPVGLAARIGGLRIRSKDAQLLDLVLRHAGEAVADGPMRAAIRQNALLQAIGKAQRKLIPYLLTERTEIEIAQAINRSRHTVHDHVKLIYSAWGVNTRAAMCDVWNGRKPAPIHTVGVEIRTHIGKPTNLESEALPENRS